MKPALYILFLLLSISISNATTYTVTNLNDSGSGSLRQAISDANGVAATIPSPNVINFGSLSGTIILSSVITISNHLSIQGPATGGIILSGNNATSILGLTSSNSYSVRITNLIFENATSSTGGAAIKDGMGSLFVTSCTFRNNQSTGTGQGGAIHIGGGVTATFIGCTFKNNTSGNVGGAIANYGTTNLKNCTFFGNTSNTLSGGAVMNYTTLNATNCTMTGNGTNAISTSGGTTTLKNSIVVGNGTDIAGTLTYSSSLLGTNNTSYTTAFGYTAAQIFGSNVLANNGGLTETIAILNTGPAIDAGVDAGEPVDQRGISRVGNHDIGAYEFETPTTGLFHSNASYGTKISPNPTLEYIEVSSGDGLKGKLSWMLLNAKGKIILEGASNSPMFSIDVKEVKEGSYLLKILDEANHLDCIKILKY